MKTRLIAVLLLAALAVSIFSGCAAHGLQQLDHAEEVIDRRLDRAEEKLESRIESIITDSPVPAAPAPAAPATAAPAQSAPTESAKITKEEAVSIALAHAGLQENQVTRLRTEFDYDDGRPEYEVDFHHDRYEYDYEIHAETGKIIGWDKDLED